MMMVQIGVKGGWILSNISKLKLQLGIEELLPHAIYSVGCVPSTKQKITKSRQQQERTRPQLDIILTYFHSFSILFKNNHEFSDIFTTFFFPKKEPHIFEPNVWLPRYGVDYGPLVHPIGRDQVAKQVKASVKEGARLLYGGATVAKPPEDTGKRLGLLDGEPTEF